ncbi:MAG: hypothetical protein ACREBD_16980, partial [Blastocatellia bacterium]
GELRPSPAKQLAMANWQLSIRPALSAFPDFLREERFDDDAKSQQKREQHATTPSPHLSFAPKSELAPGYDRSLESAFRGRDFRALRATGLLLALFSLSPADISDRAAGVSADPA